MRIAARRPRRGTAWPGSDQARPGRARRARPGRGDTARERRRAAAHARRRGVGRAERSDRAAIARSGGRSRRSNDPGRRRRSPHRHRVGRRRAGRRRSNTAGPARERRAHPPQYAHAIAMADHSDHVTDRTHVRSPIAARGFPAPGRGRLSPLCADVSWCCSVRPSPARVAAHLVLHRSDRDRLRRPMGAPARRAVVPAVHDVLLRARLRAHRRRLAIGWFFVAFGFLLDLGSYFGTNRYRPSSTSPPDAADASRARPRPPRRDDVERGTQAHGPSDIPLTAPAAQADIAGALQRSTSDGASPARSTGVGHRAAHRAGADATTTCSSGTTATSKA